MPDLFLSDDVVADGPPPRRGRPRWVDGLGLAAVVLGIVAIGVLGDRGSRDPSPAPTTTSSTTTTTRPAPATTLPTTSTTTTIAFGAPPLPTHTVLLLAGGGSRPMLVDVDSGKATPTAVPYGYGIVATAGGFVVPAPAGAVLLPVDGGPLRELPLGPQGDGRQLVLPSTDGRTFWVLGRDGGGERIAEHDLRGLPTGRDARIPPAAGVVAVLDDAVVVSARGDLAAIAFGTGGVRDLGSGDVLAAHERSIARVSCPELRCRLQVVDTGSGRSRTLPDLPGVADLADRGAFSPNGHWLAFSLLDPAAGVQTLRVVNVDDGRTWATDALVQGSPIAFSVDGSVVFGVAKGTLCAYTTATGEERCFPGLDAAVGIQELAAAPGP